MDDQPSDPIPQELRVLLDAEFVVDGLRSDADQPKLESALSGVPGIEALSFLEGKLAIRYDAERVTEAQLREKIRQAGFQITGSEAAPASPRVESPDENR
jgi:hypothetical protein